MSQKVIIASDSTTDLSAELIREHDIRIVPLGVSLGERQYRDGLDINPDMIYEHYQKTGELPRTSAVNVDGFVHFFEDCKKEDADVVFFTISSDMSSTYNNACLACRKMEGIHVVDTRNLSTGGGLLVLRAAEMAKEGKSAEEIAKTCEELAPYVDASFVVDDLEFLRKGGRCSAVAAVSAALLRIKPCIVVRNGKMSVGKKYHGRFDAALKKYIDDQLKDTEDLVPDHVFVTHAGCDEAIWQSAVEQVKSIGVFKDILVTRAGCTVSSHCGRNTLGVLFIRKKPLQ